jgi:hypothetical protein
VIVVLTMLVVVPGSVVPGVVVPGVVVPGVVVPGVVVPGVVVPGITFPGIVVVDVCGVASATERTVSQIGGSPANWPIHRGVQSRILTSTLPHRGSLLDGGQAPPPG